MASTFYKGRRGEERALSYLLKNGPRFRHLHSNYRRRCGEIDLVLEEHFADRPPEIVFVEVRTLRNPDFPLIETLTPLKRRRIELAARIFLLDYGGPARTLRFDVMLLRGGVWEHIRDAW